MAMFGRTHASAAVPPVTAFWSWWVDSGYRIHPGQASDDTDELSRRVHAVHADLTWHFSKGETSEHRLTVSANGIASVRPAAERWLRAAPSSTTVWEYRAAQEADPHALSNQLQIAGRTFDLKMTTFRVEVIEEELRVHVGVFHPEFRVVPESVRVQITYLVLDWLLGEDNVERWLGNIEALDVAPDPALPGAAVIAAKAHLAAERDRNIWTLGRGTDAQGNPFIATFRRGLRWIDSPTLDRHQIITAPYRAQSNGLPADIEALDELRDIESGLEAVLGTRGVLVAHETGMGTRRFHAYTDGDDRNIDAAIGDWAGQQRLTNQAHLDPAWSQVRHYTG